MATRSFAAMEAGYRNMWASLTIKPADRANVDRFAAKIIAGERQYREVEAATGVPWFFIGALHMRESSCHFAGVLHNGEKIIGTNRKTRLVPAGRGPFNTWSEAAVDALKLKDLHRVDAWPVARMGFEAERFNGWGYANKRVNSPYVWAGSNHEQGGKYVADHVWDPNADDTQIGVLTVIKAIAEKRPDVAAVTQGAPPVAVPPSPAPEQPTTPKPIPAAPKPADGQAVGWGTMILLALGSAAAWLQEHALYIIGGAVALAVPLVAYRFIKGRYPWTGKASPEPSPPSLQPSANSLAPLSDHLAALSAELQAGQSPEPLASKPLRKLSAPPSPKTRTRSKSSKSSKPRALKKSSPKPKSKSRG